MKGKQIIIGENLKQKVFYNNLSTYLKLINKFLSKKIKLEKLGKYIKVLGGYAFKSSQYQQKGIPVIRISDFQNEKIDLSSVKYYEEKSEYDRYQLFEGDIIIAMTGGTIGKLGVVQENLGKLYLNQRVGKFNILNPKEFFDKYIYWLARGIQERVKSIGYGGAQPNISGKQIEEMEFPIPDKKIQKKIVNFLECLRDDCIEEREYFNKETEREILKLQSSGKSLFQVLDNSQNDENLLKKLKQAILQEAVQGKLVSQNPKDEPASELLKKIKIEKEKLIKEGKIRKQKELPAIENNEIPYELPSGWEWCRLGDVLKLIMGQSPPSSSYNQKQKGLPFYQGKSDFGKVFPTPRIWCDNPKKIVRKNDILICVRAPVGPTNLCEEESCIGRGLAGLRPILFNYNYLLYFFKAIEPEFSKKGFGSTFMAITKKDLDNQILPLPPLAEQKRIVEKVDFLMEACDELELMIGNNKDSSERLMGAVLREVFEE